MRGITNDSLDHHCWKKGINLSNMPIKTMPFTTVQACKEECAKTEGCVAFTTQAGTTNKCRLRDKDHNTESSNLISVSARMSCYEGKVNCTIYITYYKMNLEFKLYYII